MLETQISKKYDLEDRTLKFASDIRSFVKLVPRTIGNVEDCNQLTRSSGSIGANYIEANESLSRKDFLLRIMICRKEAKETRYWLNLIDAPPGETSLQKEKLIQEVTELMKIFGSIIEKSR